MIGQGSTLLNTRQKVGACNGVEVTVTKIDGLKNNGDWITGNDLYLKVSPEPEGRDTTKVQWNSGSSSKNLNKKFCWADKKVSKVEFAVMDKDWLSKDDMLATVEVNLNEKKEHLLALRKHKYTHAFFQAVLFFQDQLFVQGCFLRHGD